MVQLPKPPKGGVVRSETSSNWYFGAARAQTILISFAGAVAASLKAKPEDVAANLGQFGAWLGPALEDLQAQAWWLSPSCLLLAWLLKHLKQALGAPQVWKELQQVVDEMRSDVYGPQTGDYHHHHRVTLYEHRRRWWCFRPGSTWLMPFVRSGHTSKSNVRRFRVDRARPGCQNGIAGRAWESEGFIHIEGLPSLCPQSSDDDFKRYAEATNIAVAELRSKCSSSRSFWAVRVMANGAPWGVLVLDSVAETMSSKKAMSAMKQNARVLSLLLPRV